MAVLAVAVLVTASLVSIGLDSAPAGASVRPSVGPGTPATCATVAFTTVVATGVNTPVATTDTRSVTSVTGTVADPQYNISCARVRCRRDDLTHEPGSERGKRDPSI